MNCDYYLKYSSSRKEFFLGSLPDQLKRIYYKHRKSQFGDKGVLIKSHLFAHGHLSAMINVALEELICNILL